MQSTRWAFVETASSVAENAGPAVLQIVSTSATRDVQVTVGTVSGGTATAPDGKGNAVYRVAMVKVLLVHLLFQLAIEV